MEEIRKVPTAVSRNFTKMAYESATAVCDNAAGGSARMRSLPFSIKPDAALLCVQPRYLSDLAPAMPRQCSQHAYGESAKPEVFNLGSE